MQLRRLWESMRYDLETVPRQSLRQRVTRGAVWSVLGSGTAQASSLLVTLVCTRSLGVRTYGELGILITTANLFTAIAAMGLGVTASKYVAEWRDKDPGRAGRIIGLSSLTAAAFSLAMLALLTVAAGSIANHLNAPQLKTDVRIAGVMMFFLALNNAQVGALTGLEAFDVVALGNLIRAGLMFILVPLSVLWGGRRGALLGYATAAVATYAVHQILLRRSCAARRIRITWYPQREELATLLAFSLPVLISSLSFTPAAWLSNVLLVTRSSFRENGLFSAMFQWHTAILFLPAAVSSLALPMLSNIVGERDGPKYKKVLAINFALTTSLALLVAGPIAIAADRIARIYGPGFGAAAPTLRLLCLSAVLMSFNVPIGHAIWSVNAPVAGMFLALMRGATLVAASYFLSAYGAVGLAGAYVTMGLVQTVVQVPYMIRRIGAELDRWSMFSLCSAVATPDQRTRPVVMAAQAVQAPQLGGSSLT